MPATPPGCSPASSLRNDEERSVIHSFAHRIGARHVVLEQAVRDHETERPESVRIAASGVAESPGPRGAPRRNFSLFRWPVPSSWRRVNGRRRQLFPFAARRATVPVGATTVRHVCFPPGNIEVAAILHQFHPQARMCVQETVECRRA